MFIRTRSRSENVVRNGTISPNRLCSLGPRPLQLDRQEAVTTIQRSSQSNLSLPKLLNYLGLLIRAGIQSCDRCSRSRAQDRGDSSSNTNSKTNLNNRGSNNENNRVRTPSKTPQAPGYKPIRPKKSRNFTESCYNENICCQYWATIELCGVYPQPMAGTCPVSCSFCVPKTYYHGTCADYSVHCPYWKRLGECEKNTWMSENCRKSCDTCTNMLDLRKLCQGPMAPLAKEIKWMKSHRRSGLIDGWQGSSRDWNRLSVDAQNYGAQHDQQNSGDAHPTVPSYKPDIKKNTWVREHDWGKQGKMIQ